MRYEKQINNEINTLKGLQTLVEIYGEIASVRMMKVRSFVLSSRDFLSAINDIFIDSLAQYASKIAELVKSGKMKKGGRVTFLAHNGKTVAVFIAANTGFYGEVVKNTFRKFRNDISKKDVEITVIGRLGLSLVRGAFPKRPYTYFDMPDYGIDQAKLENVIKHLVQYEVIKVYFGRYDSVITQEATKLDISSGTPVSEQAKKPKVKYIFEPDVEKVLMFFETEIFASLFDQAIRESQLAKFASRILAMDTAGENIRGRLSDIGLEKLRLTHRISNRKQIELLSSIGSIYR